MGEFKVHRVRFFDYMPSSIRAMAFNCRTERLAVARVDGTVEVFNLTDNYFQEKVRGSLIDSTAFGHNSLSYIFQIAP